MSHEKKKKKLAWHFLREEEVNEQRMGKQRAPREKKKNRITQFMTPDGSGGSFKLCVSYWNSIERISCVFMPHFWDLSFDFIFKTLIYACERARGLIVDSAWLVQG